MRMLSIKECEDTQIRSTDAYGSKYPYKGFWSSSSSPYHKEVVTLPSGWVFIFISTWGIHIRRDNDIDYKCDL